jgi:hypothetical protein
MSEFAIREIFANFMPQAWSESGMVRRARSEASRSSRSRPFTTGKVAVMLAAGIASTGTLFVTTAEAKTASAWEAPTSREASAVEDAFRGKVDPLPNWGAVVDFFSHRPKITVQYDEPEMPF